MTITAQDLAQIVAAVKAELEGPVVDPQVLGGFFQVVAGETITADHMNTALMNGVPKFPNAAARDAQWPSPPAGAFCYLVDVNILQVFDNAITGGANAWHPAGGLRMGYGLMGDGQAIPNATKTMVKMITTGGAASRPGRSVWNADGSVTTPIAGTYLVSGTVSWPSNATGERRLYIQRFTNGDWYTTGVAGGMTEDVTAGAGQMYQSATAMVLCNAGDKVSLQVYQSSGAPLTLVTGYNRLAVHLLGAE